MNPYFKLRQEIIGYDDNDCPFVAYRNCTIEQITVDEDGHAEGIWQERKPGRTVTHQVAKSSLFAGAWHLI